MNNAGTTAAAFANLKAQRVSGVFVEVDEDQFIEIVAHSEAPLIIIGPQGIWRKRLVYLTAHRGFMFVTYCDQEIELPASCCVLHAKRLWIPE